MSKLRRKAMSRTIYVNPPIDEATCQFVLAEEVNWNSETASHLFDHVRESYPGLPQQQQLFQANMAAPAQGGSLPNLTLTNGNRIIFTDEGGPNRLSVGPATISTHRARPYSGFKHELLPRTKRDLPRVLSAFDREGLFKAISVRYVNRISVPGFGFELTEFFNYWAAQNGLPPPFDGTLTGFFYRTAAQHATEPQNLTITFGTLDPGENESNFILDMDLVHQFARSVSTEQAIDQLVQLQELINTTFESIITDRCRELFK
jgi:uncharacterized protein (TIGR04255 family)